MSDVRKPGHETESLRCAGIARFVDTYLDQEFGERERAEFEAHVAECEACRQKVRTQAAWKQVVREHGPREQAPAALRNRVQRALSAAEREKTVGARRAAVRASWRRFAVRVMPVAAVAGLVGTFVVSRMSFAPVAADIVAKHRRNLPIEVSGGADQVRRWYADKVDFPVRPPPLPGASLRGGRIANVGDRQAAYLVYDANGNKVSVFIFDPGDLRLDAPRKEIINNQEVYLDEERGYNVALFRERGVGYAITGDLDRAQMLKLVSGAVQP